MGIGHSIGTLLIFVLEIYSWFILIRVLISWVNPDPYNPIVQFLARATDPVLRPFQRRIPSLAGIDLSPIAALLAIMLAQQLIQALFSDLGGGALLAMLGRQLFTILHLLLTLYLLLLVARGGINIHSWLTFRQGRPPRINPYAPFNRFLFQVTEPTVRPFRGVLPTYRGLDISPLVAALLLLLMLGVLPDLILAALSSSATEPSPVFIP
ncbi:MAG: YggT family protein [Magnetococcales bacterium]|nr:YggT family protein [Magnetococcales bacterium]